MKLSWEAIVAGPLKKKEGDKKYKLYILYSMNSDLAYNAINARQEWLTWYWLIGLLEAILGQVTIESERVSKTRTEEKKERRKETKERTRKKVEASLIFANPIFAIAWSLKVISWSMKLHFDAKTIL